jgi:ribonucleoside-diphosphate reductase alpha chain
MMRVQKRDNTFEPISFDKVLRRIRNLCQNLKGVSADEIAQKVCARIYDGVKTSELDELAAQLCASLVTTHPEYGILASRIIISNHHKNTSPSFSETINMLFNAKDVHGVQNPLISQELFDIVKNHKSKLNTVIDYQRDFLFDYFGFKTLERSYLLKIEGKVVERPQHMWMRVALGIHGSDIKSALETYDLMSQRYFTHATPTLFNSGTPRAQLASCFLLGMEDSISGIFKTVSDSAQISKYAGGIGIHIHDIRATGSHIRGTNGISTGIIPMLRVLNNTARYVNQGGKRNGSIAIYLEPWHSDIEAFLDIRKNHGSEEDRCRDLFTAMWIPDLFMKRVQENGDWSLMCPDECRGLSDAYGDDFEKLYTKYESEGKFHKQIKAQQLWMSILKSQIETGTPYLCYKDAANNKSNQKNLGTIKSSNLCSEIFEYSDHKSYATCNLASIALPTYITYDESGKPTYNFKKLHEIAQVITRNINKVIDRTFYPVPETETNNKQHRPIGIGVQGLANTFAMMRMPFDSTEAAQLNKDIFETIYHGALTASMLLSKEREELRNELDNCTVLKRKRELTKLLHLIPEETALTKYRGAYSTFDGSPASQGLLQFDLWNEKPGGILWNWDELKENIVKYGIRNSLLLAPMPTASTSQILGFNESIEPFTSNIYQRQTLAGEFVIINKHLIQDLIDIGLWDSDLKNRIFLAGGSIQNIEEIPEDIRALYKTAWEMKQKILIDQAADRGIYVCQSQSLNLFVEDPEFSKLSNMHFYGWKRGLKTGVYYLRTRPRAKITAFTIEPPKLTQQPTINSQMIGSSNVILQQPRNSPKRVVKPTEEEVMACRRDNPEGCLMCGS